MSVVFGKDRPDRFVAMSARQPSRHQPLSRISVSMPEVLLAALDRQVNRQGFPSRSHAIALVLGQFIVEHREIIGDEVTVGTVTVLHSDLYDVHRQLARIRSRCQESIVSSINVPLEEGQTLEIMVVRGPARSLKAIGDEIARVRGVVFGRTQLVGSQKTRLHGLTAAGERGDKAVDIDRIAAAS
jgi:CopG family nickel-responsive transcriptional regulator